MLHKEQIGTQCTSYNAVIVVLEPGQDKSASVQVWLNRFYVCGHNEDNKKHEHQGTEISVILPRLAPDIDSSKTDLYSKSELI